MIAIAGGGLRTGSTVMWQIVRDIVVNYMDGKSGELSGNIHTHAGEWALDEGWVSCKLHEYYPVLDPHVNRIKVVVTVRDPRDVVISLANFRNETPEQVMADHRLWTRNTTALHEWWEAVPGDKVMAIKYEQYVVSPVSVVTDVATFFGAYHVALSAKRCNRIADKWSIENNRKRAKQNFAPGHPEYMRGSHINSGKIGQWQGVLTDSQLERIHTEYADYMKWFGYE